MGGFSRSMAQSPAVLENALAEQADDQGAAKIANAVQIVSTLATFRGLAGTASRDIYVRGRSSDGDGYQGQFRWDSSDLSAEVTNDTQSAVFVAPDSDSTGASGAWVRRDFDGAVYVTWAGAVNSKTNDSASAINAAADLVRYLTTTMYRAVSSDTTATPHHTMWPRLHFPNGFYRCNSSLWWGSDGDYDDFVKYISADNATILSHATNEPAVDMSGGYGAVVNGLLTIWGDQSDSPEVGLLLARHASAESAGKHRFTNVRIMGYFEKDAYINYGAEVNRWVNCEIRNIRAGSRSSVFFTSNNETQTVSSPNATLSTGYQSSYADVFVACDIHYDVEGIQETGRTHDGANNASVLTDSGSTWAVNVLVGRIISNLTDGSSGIITANTATTITATLSGGTDNDWDTSDEYYLSGNAPVVVESIDYGPKFIGCYFDVLQGGTVKTPVCIFRSDPTLSSSQKRTEGPTFTDCVVEDDYYAFLRFEPTAAVQHIKVNGCNLAETSPGGADIVVDSGADVRRYEMQRFKGINTEEISYTNNGILREKLSSTGFVSARDTSGYYRDQTTLTRDGTWRTLNVKDDLGFPNHPERILLKVRVQTTGTISNTNKAQFRGDSGDNASSYADVQPQVSNVDLWSEVTVPVSGSGTIEYNIPSTIDTIQVQVMGYFL